jgi:hypothetical protein
MFKEELVVGQINNTINPFAIYWLNHLLIQCQRAPSVSLGLKGVRNFEALVGIIEKMAMIGDPGPMKHGNV